GFKGSMPFGRLRVRKCEGAKGRGSDWFSVQRFNRHSSIVNRHSSIVNRQSSFVNRQSSIVNRQSSIVNRQSSFVMV
ncbi:MAG: hypothetical protein CVU14_09750, partial [Bacteroidetes bacterium HGW-Bacteroidetes-9]